ncbi:MAG: branched-chain amino acid aminotransferase [Pseudobdellovibrionaceae bacterium]
MSGKTGLPIHLSKTSSPAPKPPAESLSFGKYFTDHMFKATYSGGAWKNFEITARGPLSIDPGACVLHYGQALFEGMKAFRQQDGRCVLFRPDYNWARMKSGAERLCMVAPPQNVFVEGIRELVRVDQEWIPHQPGCSLYIRPTLIGTEAFLGVRPAQEYLFFVILSPVGAYYSSGTDPIKIWVEEEYLRAAPGGLGETKAAANYAGSLKAALVAREKGYSQVLWLDVDKKNVEEVGTMNVFFVFDDEIVTPQLSGTILAGGVRDAILTLLKTMHKKVSQKKLSLQEIREASSSGRLKEAFGTGTAAVVTPIGELAAKNWHIKMNSGPLASELSKTLTEIQTGIRPDPYGWISPL